MAARKRLDAELVRRELAPSREQAQRWIAEHQVTVNGSIAQKASSMVAPADAVEVLAPPARFVGRGGDKMLSALTQFGIDPTGMACVDVGSSTGGFTDCVLQEGAVSVVAIDVGRAQLHDRLRRDDRITVREQTDVRHVDPPATGAPFDLVVIDVSFIGLDRILDVVSSLAGPSGQIVALVKPQFEAGRTEVSKGRGVIHDPEIWTRVLLDSARASRRRSLQVLGFGLSPIKGGAGKADGNVEFFLHLAGPEFAATSGPIVSAEDEAAVNHIVAAAQELP